MARRSRGRIVTLAVALSVVVIVIAVTGIVFVASAGKASPPSFPPSVPGAHRLWASQTTDMLEGNQIVSIALYRVPDPPAAAIAYYRDQLRRPAAVTDRFDRIVHGASPSALPPTLRHLPKVFVDGSGANARADYTYAQYSSGVNDVGVAVDLRHPHGPTLVFIEMLSQ